MTAPKTNQPLYLIDASIYIFRAYFSIPDQWFSPDGYSVNALYGYTQFLISFLRRTQPQQLAAAFDESLGSCFRNDIYPDYKSSRALPDEALAFQLEACKGLTEFFGVAALASERYEADDIIATLAQRARNEGRSVCVVTRDKDLGQLLISEHDQMWDFAADKFSNREQFTAQFGVRPDQMKDFLALVGDSVDDIPGVPGIGKKTAAQLLQQYDSVEQLYQQLDHLAASSIRGSKSLAVKLLQYQSQIAMAQALVALESSVPLGSNEQLLWQRPSAEMVIAYLDEFGIGQAFERPLQQLLAAEQ